MIYKFVSHEISPLDVYKDTHMYQLHEKLKSGDEPTREEKNRNLVFGSENPVYKYMGYVYDYRPFLKKFWIETRYYGIMTIWAWDKTAIRKNETTKSLQISKIVEIQ